MERPHMSVDGKTELDHGLINLTDTCLKNRDVVLEEVILKENRRTDLSLQTVYVTKEERMKKTAIENQTKAAIVTIISQKLDLVPTISCRTLLKDKLDVIIKKIGSTRKSEILALHEEVDMEIKTAAE